MSSRALSSTLRQTWFFPDFSPQIQVFVPFRKVCFSWAFPKRKGWFLFQLVESQHNNIMTHGSGSVEEVWRQRERFHVDSFGFSFALFWSSNDWTSRSGTGSEVFHNMRAMEKKIFSIRRSVCVSFFVPTLGSQGCNILHKVTLRGMSSTFLDKNTYSGARLTHQDKVLSISSLCVSFQTAWGVWDPPLPV